jgi:hypothetical protein
MHIYNLKHSVRNVRKYKFSFTHGFQFFLLPGRIWAESANTGPRNAGAKMNRCDIYLQSR